MYMAFSTSNNPPYNALAEKTNLNALVLLKHCCILIKQSETSIISIYIQC